MIGLAMMLAAGGGAFYTGNDLYAGVCSDTRNRVDCALYVTGAVDMILTMVEAENRPMPFCLPENVDVGQLGDVFRKELREHPERRNMRGAVLVLTSMVGAFPCAKP
jgi:hypothetical protein